jgi:hypothetical protein
MDEAPNLERGEAVRQQPLVVKISIDSNGKIFTPAQPESNEAPNPPLPKPRKSSTIASIARLRHSHVPAKNKDGNGPEGLETIQSRPDEVNTEKEKGIEKVEEKPRTSVEDNGAERPFNSSEISPVQDAVEPIAELYLLERPCGKDAERQLFNTLDALFGELPRKDLEAFLEGHSKDALSQIGTYAMEVITGGEDALDHLKPFFAKWSRHVTQSKDNWKVERLIRAKKPYDVDATFGDPREKGIPHTRYSRFPENCRGYYLISEMADEINHALKECVSVFSKTVGEVYKCTKRCPLHSISIILIRFRCVTLRSTPISRLNSLSTSDEGPFRQKGDLQAPRERQRSLRKMFQGKGEKQLVDGA